jgi:hypothetical protein
MKAAALILTSLITAATLPAQTATKTSFTMPMEGRAVREPLQSRSLSTQSARKAQLRSQLNNILPTRETARGLVVTVPGRDSSAKVPGEVRDRLAKVAALFPPDVSIRVEAYSDGRNWNNRAEAIRSVLEDNDSSPRDIETAAFLATNARRPTGSVEILITGPGLGQSTLTSRTATDTSRNRAGD